MTMKAEYWSERERLTNRERKRDGGGIDDPKEQIGQKPQIRAFLLRIQKWQERERERRKETNKKYRVNLQSGKVKDERPS